MTIYPLDSTDPAALNAIVRKIAAARNLVLPRGEELSNPTFLRTLLSDVMMVGVAMGMTSEEPITHLEWFDVTEAEQETLYAELKQSFRVPDEAEEAFR